MAQSGSGKKIANNLVTASCAGVLAVYIAGYTRTQHAAERFTAQIAERRPVVHDPTMPPIPEPFHSPERKAEHVKAPAKPMPAPVPAETAEIPPPDPPVANIAPPAASPEPARRAETAPVAAAPKVEETPVPPPAPVWKDGTYTGWGYSRHGNIEASVVIESGRIASATISQCRTRYSCSVIERLPPQVAQRQSPDVDYVSGATQSADAFYGAVVAALGKAK
jgi:uncharacterized protein with FMN-binding domain